MLLEQLYINKVSKTAYMHHMSHVLNQGAIQRMWILNFFPFLQQKNL